jgi:hypothetical protein
MILVSLLPAAAFAAPPTRGGNVTPLFQCKTPGTQLPFPVSAADVSSGNARIGWIYKEPNPPTNDSTTGSPTPKDTIVSSYLDGGIAKPHQGVDFIAAGSSALPVYALGNGTVVKKDSTHLTIWYQGIKSTDIDTGVEYSVLAVNYSIITNVLVSVDDTVHSGQHVADSSIDNNTRHFHMSFGTSKDYNDLDPSQSIDPTQILGADLGWARRYAESPITPLDWDHSDIHFDWSIPQWCGGPYFDKSTAFAVGVGPNPTDLYSISERTKVWVKVGQLRLDDKGQHYPPFQDIGDIATSPDGVLYMTDGYDLYHVEQNTGLAKHIGSFNHDVAVNALAFTPSTPSTPLGILYGADQNGALFTINTNTGALTTNGSYGAGFLSPGDLVVDERGTLYATIYNNASSKYYLAKVDRKSGQATPIGDGFAEDVVGLFFFEQSLFGVSQFSSECNPSTGALLAIDTTTGQVANKGCLTFDAFGASSAPQASQAQQNMNNYQEHECLEAQQRKHKPSLMERLYRSLGLIAYSC